MLDVTWLDIEIGAGKDVLFGIFFLFLAASLVALACLVVPIVIGSFFHFLQFLRALQPCSVFLL